MKRKTLLSISLAALLVVAMAATAFAAPGSVSCSGPGSISTGETISITVTGTGLGINAEVSTSGLSFVSVSNAFSSQGGVVLLPDFGTPSVTYTYTVTAGAGETASFTLSGATSADDNDQVVSISGDSWSATVPANEPEPSEEPPAPSTTPGGEQSAAPSSGSGSGGGSNGGTSGGSSSGKTDKMPKTGDATMDLWVLAVIAAGCTGAAVVAGKKVFSR